MPPLTLFRPTATGQSHAGVEPPLRLVDRAPWLPALNRWNWPVLFWHRLRLGELGTAVWRARAVPGWASTAELEALARLAFELPAEAVIVEIGSFLGQSSVALAGARQLSGSGRVHCIDPFDGSGDPYSARVYAAVGDRLGAPLRAAFERNVRRAGVRDRVQVHQAREAVVAPSWRAPIDLIFFDGDQSFAGAAGAFDRWLPHVRPGGYVALHNSAPGIYDPGHGGAARVAAERFNAPRFGAVWRVDTTTFGRVATAGSWPTLRGPISSPRSTTAATAAAPAGGPAPVTSAGARGGPDSTSGRARG